MTAHRTVDKAVAGIAKAIRTLDPVQGIVGRRNTRARVASAVRALRRAMDAEFPTIRKTPKEEPPTSLFGEPRRVVDTKK